MRKVQSNFVLKKYFKKTANCMTPHRCIILSRQKLIINGEDQLIIDIISKISLLKPVTKDKLSNKTLNAFNKSHVKPNL